jgi:hypothetical protein
LKPNILEFNFLNLLGFNKINLLKAWIKDQKARKLLPRFKTFQRLWRKGRI